MKTELELKNDHINMLQDHLDCISNMISRATRIPCIHGTVFYDVLNHQVTCEHCEILKLIPEIIKEMQGG